MPETYVIDACALIAAIANEEGSEVLAKKFAAAIANDKSTTILMHKLNLLEVYYDIYRRSGESAAKLLLDEIKNNPVTIVSEISDELFNEAGRLKATYSVSIADTFALALAKINDAQLITSDHHEFDILEKCKEAKFLWIR
jgi:predicted nucleic acid-binding protein